MKNKYKLPRCVIDTGCRTTNSPYQLAYFKKYDITDQLKELKELKDICKNFRGITNE